VCEVVPVSVNHDDAVITDSGAGTSVSQKFTHSAAVVDADLAAQPSQEVLEAMRARLRTEVLAPSGLYDSSLLLVYAVMHRNRLSTRYLFAWLHG
jgi:hypothetical protein